MRYCKEKTSRGESATLMVDGELDSRCCIFLNQTTS